MAIAHVATGARTTGNAGTTTTTIARPTSGNTAKNITLVGLAIKPETATTTAETGWWLIANGTGGTGTSALDTGPTRIATHYQTLVGGETGSVTFDQANTPNSVASCMITYSKATGGAWGIATTTGDDNTHGTGRTATGAAISLQSGDMIVAFVASDTDATTAYTSPTFSATGMTFGTVTERLGAGGVSQNNDCGITIFEAAITAGTEATVAPTLTLSGGPSSCGPIAFIRLRETTLIDSFESGSDGGAFTATGNWVSTVGSPTYESDAAVHGAMGLRLDAASEAARYTIGPASCSGSFYMICRAVASGALRFLQVQSSAAGVFIQLRQGTAGTFSMANVSNVQIGSATTLTWAAGDVFRLDWQATITGTAPNVSVELSVRFFKNANIEGTTPDETLTQTAVGGASTTVAQLAFFCSAAGFVTDVDTVRYSDQLEWLGPYAPPAPTDVGYWGLRL